MSTSQLIEQKYVALNKSCIGWKDIAVLLDVSERKAKDIFAALKKKHDNPYITSTSIPMSLIEEDLMNYGMNPSKITKAYKLEMKKGSPEWTNF